MFSGSPQLCWLWAVLCGCVLWISQLRVSVSHTTLRVGETVQLAVTKKIWFGTEPLAHPERTQYITNWESMAVVEPDGKVTAVGTWGEREEMIPAASIGRLNRFTVLAFARNGEAVGWKQFQLEHPASGNSR